MDLYNNELYSDIKVVTHDKFIFCHKAYLVKSQPFKNLICNDKLNEICILEHFLNFDEKTVISYIKYLYNNDDIDYDNITELIRFADFACDDNFKFKPLKIKNLKGILLDISIPDNIYNRIIGCIKFNTLDELFNNCWIYSISKDKEYINKLMLRLGRYNKGNCKYEAKYLKSKGYYGVIATHLMDLIFYNFIICDAHYHENFIQHFTTEKEVKALISLISESIITNKNSYFIQYLLKNQIETQISHDYKCLTFNFVESQIFIRNHKIFEDLGFKISGKKSYYLYD